MKKLAPDTLPYIGSDHQQEPNSFASFHRFFEFVDGDQDPLPLISSEISHRLLDAQGRIRIPDSQVKYINLSRKTGINATRSGYQLNRYLDHGADSYEAKLMIEDGGLKKLLSDYMERQGKETLRVFDFGCGIGLALSELLEETEFIDQENSVGITLHPIGIPMERQKHIVIADATNTAPKVEFSEADNKIEVCRFDVLMSIYGAVHYNPLNQLEGYTLKMFGILQAINFVKIGGLLLINRHSLEDASIGVLIKLGIVKKLEAPLDRHLNRKEFIRDAAYEVVRRPNFQEILELLRIRNDEYTLFLRR